MSAVPIALAAPDPAFAAARALDSAGAAYSEAFTAWEAVLSVLDPTGHGDWADGAGIVRQRLGRAAGPALAAFALIEQRLHRAEVAEDVALDAFMSTRPTSELGAAALRAAVRRHARRPGGWPGDEAVMLGRLTA